MLKIGLANLKKFENKKLLPLRSHISPDVKVRGVGDIEVVDEKGIYFEAVEIKHGIPIDDIMIQEYKKFRN